MRSLALALLAASCVSSDYERRDWSDYDGPGAQHFLAEEIVFPHVDDPLEPANRVSAWTTHQFLKWIVAPPARFYRCLVPEYVRTRLSKAGDNLEFPKRFVNNLLQGNLRESGIETARFAINTTVGLLGLYDPAQRFGLHPYPEDFGQTFASWGWKKSTYVFLPFFGSSTVRDGVGLVPDTLSDPFFYYAPVTALLDLNDLADRIEADLRTVEVYFDAYEPARTLYAQQREIEVTDFVWKSDTSASTQTLSAIFLVPEDADFADTGSTERVRLASGERFPYSLWLQPEPAPLAYVVPGFGGHRLSEGTLALAEIAYRNGHSVVAVSSPSNWEFMRFGASVATPGYGPVDSHDLHVALTAIDRDLERRFPGRFGDRRLGGLSLGAYQALFIAASEEQAAAQDLLVFDLYVALDPPVSVEHALTQLDRFYNAPLSFPAAEREERIEEIFAKVLYLSNGDLQPGMELPFTELEAQFLIGLSFRLELQFLLLQSQELHDLGVLRTPRERLHRAPAFREASEYSYLEYVYAFVLPYYAEHAQDSGAERLPAIRLDEAGARALFEQSDLRSVEAGLAANERVRLFANENDFLLRAEDLDWLRATLGERVTLFPAGGHLGNLHREAIQEVIADTVRQAVERNAAP